MVYGNLVFRAATDDMFTGADLLLPCLSGGGVYYNPGFVRHAFPIPEKSTRLHYNLKKDLQAGA